MVGAPTTEQRCFSEGDPCECPCLQGYPLEWIAVIRIRPIAFDDEYRSLHGGLQPLQVWTLDAMIGTKL